MFALFDVVGYAGLHFSSFEHDKCYAGAQSKPWRAFAFGVIAANGVSKHGLDMQVPE